MRTLLAQYAARIGSVLFWLWVCGASMLIFRLVLQLMSLGRVKSSLQPLDARSVLFEARCKRPVTVGVSDKVNVPCFLGLTKPVIAIPRSLANELPSSDLKSIILHECAHVRRYDDWLNLAEQMALALQFFNPALRLMAQRSALEREIACDDQVILSEDRVYYAECLSSLARRASVLPAAMAPGFFAGRRQLLVRIESLLDRRHAISPVLGRLTYGVVAVLCVMTLMLSQVGIPVLAATTASSSAQTNAPTVHRTKPDITIIAAPIEEIVIAVKEHRAVTVKRDARVMTHRTTVAAPAKPVNAAIPAHAPLALPAPPPPRVPVMRSVPVAPTVTVAPPAIVVPSTSEAFSTPPIPPIPAIPAIPTIHVLAEQSGNKTIIIYPAGDLKKLHDRGITDAYIKALRAAGYRVLTVDDVTELQDHGVDAEFAKEIRSMAGMRATVRALVELRDHGVDAEYVKSMKALLHSEADLRAMARLHDHMVSAELAKAMAEVSRARLNTNAELAKAMAAFNKSKLDVPALTRLSDHGVSADYLRSMAKYFKAPMDADAFSELCDHGVTPSYLGSLVSAGYGDLPVRDVVRLYDHGVRADYLLSLKQAGMPHLPLEDVIRLYDHGVTASYIAALRNAGFSQLSTDDIIRLYDRGVSVSCITGLQHHQAATSLTLENILRSCE